MPPSNGLSTLMDPTTPIEPPIPAAWGHDALRARIFDALRSLPIYFSSDLDVGGVSALDLFTLNTPLGAIIEEQCVATLNRLRPVWDPTSEYLEYSFERQSQTFPDVRLAKAGETPLLGIELKGWALLSKEGEPSFRYRVAADACAPQDLLVIVPWSFTSVISGPPKIYQPIIRSAKHAALVRNHYWKRIKEEAGADSAIQSPQCIEPYPSPKTRIEDKPAVDGGNFGRVSRSGLFDEEIGALAEESLRGIPAKYWRAFFVAFAESKGAQEIDRKLAALAETVLREETGDSTDTEAAIGRILTELKTLLERAQA